MQLKSTAMGVVCGKERSAIKKQNRYRDDTKNQRAVFGSDVSNYCCSKIWPT